MDSERHGTAAKGSLDGSGAGDHDTPYRFGWRPRASVPYPFSTRQYVRLMILRSRVQAGLFAKDLGEALAAAGDQPNQRQHSGGDA
jgi:hypothetical protein